jgi:hypothetical protein
MLNLATKKVNFVSRLVAATGTQIDSINELVGLYTEAVSLGYVAGLGNASGSPITDADLAPFPYLDATHFATIINSLGAIKSFLDAGGHTATLLSTRP